MFEFFLILFFVWTFSITAMVGILALVHLETSTKSLVNMVSK
jgi:hypothetical protein